MPRDMAANPRAFSKERAGVAQNGALAERTCGCRRACGMTSVWAPLALTAVTCGMLALPLAPALLEAWRRKDAGPLPVRGDDGDIRNFARSFRHRIEPLRSALISCAESNSVVEARLDDGDCALLIGNDGASNLDEERLSTLVLFARQARLRDQVIFEKDVYAAAGLCGGRNN